MYVLIEKPISIFTENLTKIFRTIFLCQGNVKVVVNSTNIQSRLNVHNTEVGDIALNVFSFNLDRVTTYNSVEDQHVTLIRYLCRSEKQEKSVAMSLSMESRFKTLITSVTHAQQNYL